MIREGERELMENEEGIGVYKKPKNLSKNYPKPKNRDIFRLKPVTACKTIKTEDLYSSVFTNLV